MYRKMVMTQDTVERSYSDVLREHFANERKMAFLTGPRQVGKTTLCKASLPEAAYLNADVDEDRRALLRGQREVAKRVGFEPGVRGAPGVVFDELHKLVRWKSFLKGFYDLHSECGPIAITGSSRLDIYRRGGDSMMGRYFLYRIHPLSVGELVRPKSRTVPLLEPKPIPDADWKALERFGGFPEPFLRRDERFSTRWRGLRIAQLVREDLRDLTRVQDLGQLERLALILSERSATQLNYTSLAVDLLASVDSVRRWITTLQSFHHGFIVRPWSKSIARSIAKQPKWYALDWSAVEDPGQRAETLVAVHLRKAVDGWTDLGLGKFDLHYVRDKQKHEVDFLVTRERKPWFLVEVKRSEERLSPELARFQQQLGATHAFQLVLEQPYRAVDAFEAREPTVLPARTLLSQLM